MRSRCGSSFLLLGVAAAKHVGRIAPFASGVLVALQAAALITSVVRADPAAAPRWQGPSDSMFELSRTRNVIHIVLDAFQSDVFGEILAEERPLFDRSLSGAVFFANHTGAFPTTIASIPAMLTGQVYRNDRPLQRYMRDILKQSIDLQVSPGARVSRRRDLGHASRQRNRRRTYFRLQRPYVSYDEYVQFTAWQLADLSLFRHAPHILRPAIHNDESWRLQAMFGPGDTSTRQHHSVNGAVVLDQFAQRLRVPTDEPLYKYIHVGIPHRPVVVNGDCEFIGVVRATRAAYKEQARCAVRSDGRDSRSTQGPRRVRPDVRRYFFRPRHRDAAAAVRQRSADSHGRGCEDRRQRDGAARREALEQQRSCSYFARANHHHRHTRDDSGRRRQWRRTCLASPR